MVVKTRLGTLLLWMLLALLPMRGWAHAGMHLSPTPAGSSAPTEVITPCHLAAGHVQGSMHETQQQAPAADAPVVAHDCAMCDLCHSVALPLPTSAGCLAHAPPRVESVEILALGAAPAPSLRPPRG